MEDGGVLIRTEIAVSHHCSYILPEGLYVKEFSQDFVCIHCVCSGKKYKLIQLYNIQRNNETANVNKENTILYIEQYPMAVHSSDYITHIILPRSVRVELPAA